MQCCEVSALQFTFPHNFQNTVPPTGDCLYGHINWSFVQAQQQSSLGLFQSPTSVRGGKAKHKASLWLNVQKQPVPDSSGGPWQKRFTGKLVLRTARTVGSHLATYQPILERKAAMGDGIPNVLHSKLLHHIFISFAGWYTYKVFRSMEKHYLQ